MSRTVLSFAAAALLLAATAIYSLRTGSISVGFGELVQGLIHGGNKQVEVIRDLRLPRILTAMLVGAALSASGALLQAVLRSPLADAGVIGISSGAGFVSILTVSLFPGLFFWMPALACLGGALAFVLVYTLSWKSGLDPIRMILVGIAVNATFSGLGQALHYRGSLAVATANPAAASTLTMKTWDDVAVIAGYGGVGLALAWLAAGWCNLLSLPDKSARNLGLRVARARWLVSAAAVLLAAVATAIGGLIAFVGLLVPHIARILVGSDYRKLVPFSALAGALLILAADTLGRTALAPAEIPASLLLAVIGGPFLIFLIRRKEGVHGH
ncbi:FecCD family ABC transporter permease [Paenibacillus sp. B01]|uniref:FecCD family ABC transporter permease n=1 Tax=Paenibacillus sp. B01 TaxID=2660554 RepID=UPI00129AC631|nr:iron ABC transporter permease [Paenibacillus sp. B01]QGG56215.1 iron chelate uptake ABC transporter family permease subunit [Paenibacillus sp. B01]